MDANLAFPSGNKVCGNPVQKPHFFLMNKRCSKCKQTLKKSFYNKDLSKKDKLQNYCRSCSNRYFSNLNKVYHKTLKRRFSNYKKEAARYQRKFELTIEQFTSLSNEKCSYCGGYSNDEKYCGIDRIDSSQRICYQ